MPDPSDNGSFSEARPLSCLDDLRLADNAVLVSVDVNYRASGGLARRAPRDPNTGTDPQQQYGDATRDPSG